MTLSLVQRAAVRLLRQVLRDELPLDFILATEFSAQDADELALDALRQFRDLDGRIDHDAAARTAARVLRREGLLQQELAAVWER